MTQPAPSTEALGPEEGCTLCVYCGGRPLGYGSCCEECKECAAENDRADDAGAGA